MGAGLRVGAEFVAAIIGGVVLGIVVDRWLGVAPFGLLILLVAGFGVGLLSLKRFMDGK